MKAVSKEVAVAEVNKWLDAKKTSAAKRVTFESSIDELVNAVCDGLLIVNDDNSLTHKLLFPIETTEGQVEYSEFKYKNRVKTETIHLHLQGVKSSDVDGRVLAHIAAIAGVPKSILSKMDTEDNSIAKTVASFFL